MIGWSIRSSRLSGTTEADAETASEPEPKTKTALKSPTNSKLATGSWEILEVSDAWGDRRTSDRRGPAAVCAGSGEGFT